MRTPHPQALITIIAALSMTGGCDGSGGTRTPVLDATPPVVASVSPAANATGVAATTTIVIQFNEPLDCTTVTPDSFTLTGADHKNVTGTVDCSGSTATFTPTANLATTTRHTATVANTLKDKAGNALANSHQWSFTTGAAAGTWVTAYYAGWFWPDHPPQHVNMANLTHVVFGRIAPGPADLDVGTPDERHYDAGEVVYMAGTAGLAGQLGDVSPLSVEDYLISRAHAAGKKAIVMLGGVGDGTAFDLSTRPETIDAFVENLLDYMQAHDYDGIDIDWEDFLVEPGDEEGSERRVAQLLNLIDRLKARAAVRTRWATTPLIVTFPGYAVNINYERPLVQPWQVTLASKVDQYNLMSYGLAYVADGWSSWHFCAIDGAGPSHPYDLTTSIQAYVDAGVPRSKMGIGIGFYGFAYKPPFTGPRQPLPQGAPWDTISSEDADWNWANLKNRGYLDRGTYVWDDVAKMGSRYYSADNGYPEGYWWREVDGNRWGVAGWLSYEDEASIAAKGRWVRETGVGGTIVWVINYGSPDGVTNPLMDAVGQGFLQ